MFETEEARGAQPLLQGGIVSVLFDPVQTGIALIDEQFRLCTVNEKAAAMLRQGKGLRIATGGYLTTEEVAARFAFDNFLRQILATDGNREPTQSRRFIAPQKNSLPVMVIGALYVHRGTPQSPAPPRVVLCLREFVERQRQEHSYDMLRLRYKLTTAEADLANALLAGKTLNVHSLARGVSVSTTRTQLQSLLSKVGVHRQVDLIRVLGLNK